MIRPILLALVVLSACTSQAVPVGPLLCHADLPYGGSAQFSLTEQGDTLVLDQGRGAIERLAINRSMSDARYLVAAEDFGDGRTSITLKENRELVQTFVPADGPAVFVYGECAPL